MTNPTFNIPLSYPQGSLPLHHFDLYCLEHDSELDDVGFYETIDGAGASVMVQMVNGLSGMVVAALLLIINRRLSGTMRILLSFPQAQPLPHA